jgi:hypothetical protein
MPVYRVGDLLPPLRIAVRDGTVVVPLTGTRVMVRWQKPDGTLIAEREAPALDAAQGLAAYQWQAGDLDQAGLYEAIVQLDRSGMRYSLTDPPLVQVEVLTNDFGAADPLTQVPLVGQTVDELSGTQLELAIERGRYLAWSYSNLWQTPGLGLGSVDQRLLAELAAQLAAYDLMTPPQVQYGAFKKETIGSYSYEVRAAVAGGGTGVEAIDELVRYFRALVKASAAGLDIMYPEWRQPLIERYLDPLYGGGSAGIGPAAGYEPVRNVRAQDTW